MWLLQATAGLFDDEGYLITGDAMEQLAEDTFVWIDRVKNIIKLSQVGVLIVHLLSCYACSGNPTMTSKTAHQRWAQGR